MHTDRELLELAAKAAGLQEAKQRIEFNQWDPLADDGDALRLAVALHLCVDVGRRSIEVIWADSEGEAYSIEENGEKSGSDPYAATRRAITRAAAEIGRAMP